MTKNRALRLIAAAAVVSMTVAAPALADKITERIETSISVYKELINARDQGIPNGLLKDAYCIAVIPNVIKGAFIVGGRHGKGIVSCRDDKGGWSPISFLEVTGGSFGLQIGGNATDLVLFIMSERGAKSLLKSKFTLGGDASVAAGPVGRSAEANTDYRMEADILAYAKAKGLFAGIALDGASLRTDGNAVKEFYGRKIRSDVILFEGKVPKKPVAGEQFRKVLP